MVRRAMVDIETLALTTTPLILQVGAVCEDRAYCMTINKSGAPGDVCDDTLAWWTEQPRHVYERVHAGGCDWAFSMLDFAAWVQDVQPDEIWAKGPQFDITAIEHYMGLAKIQVPWRFNQVRDLRTLMAVHGDPGIERVGDAHDALDDARHQMRQLEAILDGIDT